MCNPLHHGSDIKRDSVGREALSLSTCADLLLAKVGTDSVEPQRTLNALRWRRPVSVNCAMKRGRYWIRAAAEHQTAVRRWNLSRSLSARHSRHNNPPWAAGNEKTGSYLLSLITDTSSAHKSGQGAGAWGLGGWAGCGEKREQDPWHTEGRREREKERERENESNRGIQGPKRSQKPGRWRPATVARASQTLSEHSGRCSTCMQPNYPAAGEGERVERRGEGARESRQADQGRVPVGIGPACMMNSVQTVPFNKSLALLQLTQTRCQKTIKHSHTSCNTSTQTRTHARTHTHSFPLTLKIPF